MAYQPGQLDKQITIERATKTPDDMSGNVTTWSTLDTVFAKVLTRTGRESEQGGQVEADATYVFVIRYRSDLKMADRIVFNGQAYNIRFIPDEGGRPTYLEITAQRGVAQ